MLIWSGRYLYQIKFGNTRLIQIKNVHMSGTRFDFVQNGLESLYFNG